MLKGLIYDAAADAQLLEERMRCKELCRDYNDLRPSQTEARTSLLRRILGTVKGELLIEQPFYCDYGYNVHVGENFYANYNLVILDEAPVTFGDNVFVTVLPGVTIGDNCVIGAGSVVNKDIPAGTMAAGNPCRVIKSINQDK